MPFFRGLLTRKKLFSSASAERRKKEHDCYLKNGSSVLEELLALCDGNCRIPIRYFSAIEIENAIRHSHNKLEIPDGRMVAGSLDKRLVLIRFNRGSLNIHRDIAVTAQMSHLSNVLRLIGCCVEFEEPVMVYEYVEGISLNDLFYEKDNHKTRKSLSWGNRLRVARDVASAIVFLHTEFTTPIIHRDIKPHTVIIDENSGVAKIVDFSSSISLPRGELEVQECKLYGAYGYMAPEHALSGIFTQKTDVYSFGALLFLLLTGKKVYDIMDSTNYSKETTDFKNLPPNLVDDYIKEGNVMDIADPTILEEHGIHEIRQQLNDYLDLVKKCTADNGDDRPNMIHVARELCRIEKCFHALALGRQKLNV